MPEYFSSIGNHLWQSTVFAAMAGLLTLLLKKNRAAVRCGLWLVASVKFLLPFSLLITIGSWMQWRDNRVAVEPALVYALEGFTQPFALETSTLPATPSVSPAPIPQATVPVPALLLLVWLLGAAIVGLRWFLEWRRLRIAVKTARPFELDIVGLPVPVRTTSTTTEPGIVGVFRPVLLLPDGLMDRLTSSQIEAVLTHEFCHVRRRDNLAAAIHMVVETVFWFHPLVWWIERRLVAERERACDEEVLRRGGEPQAYAEGILNICRFYKESRLACVSGVAGANLKNRIEEIMRNHVAHRLSFTRTVVLAIAALMAIAGPIAIGAVKTMARQPQSAASTIQVKAPVPFANPVSANEAPTAKAGMAETTAMVQTAPPQAAPQNPANQNPDLVGEIRLILAPVDAPLTRETFEVASVRPTRFAAGGERGAGGGGQASIRPAGEPCGDHPNSFFLKFDPSRADISDMTVYGLIAWAYGLECPPFKGSYFIVGGPGWIKSDGYDIQAKIPEGASVYTEQPINVPGAPPVRQIMGPRFRKMLQSLLEDRFKLVVRQEKRELPVYALTVARGGSKLKTWKEGDPATMEAWFTQMGLPDEREMFRQARELDQLDRGWFIAFKGSMAQLINQVKSATDRPIVDRTGITPGDLMYRFPYSRMLAPYPSDLPVGTRASAPSAPSLFTALEQELGLRLEATTAPMDVWVIESVERPTAN